MHQPSKPRAGKPICAKAPRARAFDRDPSPRKALWPAAYVCRINRPHTWPHRPKGRTSKKTLPTESRPHMARSRHWPKGCSAEGLLLTQSGHSQLHQNLRTCPASGLPTRPCPPMSCPAQTTGKALLTADYRYLLVLSGSIVVFSYGDIGTLVFFRGFAAAIWIATLCKFLLGHFAANADPIPESMSASVIFDNHRSLHRRC